MNILKKLLSQSEKIDDIYRQNLPPEKAEKLGLYNSLKAGQIALARQNPSAFIEYAIPHEKTGKPIINAPFHREWQSFLSSVRWGVIIAPVEHGKSYQISVGRILWELGINPDLRILLIGRNEAMAKKSLRFIRQQIEYNHRVHEVFPHLRKGTKKGDQWSDTDITIARSYSSRDPSVQARGSGSTNILSSRLDLIVYDDGLDIQNTNTQYARDKEEEWFDTVAVSRLVDDYKNNIFGRIFAIGTPFNEDDLLHRLVKRPGWRFLRYSAVENSEDDSALWRPIWPEVWPLKRLLDRQKITTVTAFARTLLCCVLDTASRRFKRSWLDHMLWLGRGRGFLKRAPTQNGVTLPCFTGLDPGIGKKRSDALSCIFTVAVDSYGRRIIVDIRSGHWTGPEMLDECKYVGEQFGSEIFVEGNAAQRWMAEFGNEIGLICRAVNTGRDKWDEQAGVESLAILMRAGLIVAPSSDEAEAVEPEVKEWIDECYSYDPSIHTGDRLMASWICDKGVREYLAPRIDHISDATYR